MTSPTLNVSDHAVLRYLERVGGFEVERLRREILHRVRGAAAAGARSVVIDGYRFFIRANPAGGLTVTTVIRDDFDADDHQVERGV